MARDRQARPARPLAALLRPHLLGTAAALLAGCVSLGTAPDRLGPRFCSADPELVGTWTSRRASQLGPARMTFELHCDCTYRMRGGPFWMGVRERGRFWTEHGHLHFSRASGEVTRWPFRLANGQLLLEEDEGEVFSYRKTVERECD